MLISLLFMIAFTAQFCQQGGWNILLQDLYLQRIQRKAMKHAKRHPLIFGTLILTITGLITRIIGFFYRIYLSRLFGEGGMGIYQLRSPALSLSFFLTAAVSHPLLHRSEYTGNARQDRQP